MVATHTCSCPSPVEVFRLRTLSVKQWLSVRDTKMLLVLLHCPNGKISRALVAHPINPHCTVVSLVVGNELPHYLPDTTRCAHCTERLGQDLLGFFGSHLVGAGGDLSSHPLGWACFCTMMVTVPGHRPCEAP